MKTKQSTPTRVAIYTRTATAEQHPHDPSADAQRRVCEEHLNAITKRDGRTFVVKEHISDDGFSGRDSKRPGLARLRELVAANEIDTVIASDISRLSLSVTDFTDLISRFEGQKVHLVVPSMSLDTSTAMGRATLDFAVAFTKIERELYATRVREFRAKRRTMSPTGAGKKGAMRGAEI